MCDTQKQRARSNFLHAITDTRSSTKACLSTNPSEYVQSQHQQMKPQTDIKHNFVDLKYLDTPEHTQHPMLPCPGRLIPTHTHTHTLTPLLSHLWSYHPALTHKHTHTHTHTHLPPLRLSCLTSPAVASSCPCRTQARSRPWRRRSQPTPAAATRRESPRRM